MTGIQSLHSHTTTSDGLLAHLQLLDLAKENSVSVIAFTDHDSLPNEKVINELNRNKNHSTKWIVGIEISSNLPKEFNYEKSSGLHIVGLFVDPTNKPLLDHSAKAIKGRIDRMKKIVNNLKGLGFEIEAEDCLKASGGETVGRPHIVKALGQKSKNLHIIENMRNQMARDSLQNPELRKRYDNMMERGEQQYPYVLFLSENSYKPATNIGEEYGIDLDTTVSLIRGAGGLAFIAHYSTVKSKLSLDFIEKLIQDKRIDGVETVYGISLSGTKEGEEWARDEQAIKALAQKHNALISGGADMHKPEDLVDFAKSSTYAQETKGMAEEIIKKSNVDTTWSSF